MLLLLKNKNSLKSFFEDNKSIEWTCEKLLLANFVTGRIFSAQQLESQREFVGKNRTSDSDKDKTLNRSLFSHHICSKKSPTLKIFLT